MQVNEELQNVIFSLHYFKRYSNIKKNIVFYKSFNYLKAKSKVQKSKKFIIQVKKHLTVNNGSIFVCYK